MTTKILCAVDDTEYSNRAITLAAQLAKALGAELTLLAVNELMGGAGGKGGIAAYRWDSADLKRVLDSATAIAKQTGCSNAKTADVKSRDVARAIVIYAEDNGFDHRGWNGRQERTVAADARFGLTRCCSTCALPCYHREIADVYLRHNS